MDEGLFYQSAREVVGLVASEDEDLAVAEELTTGRWYLVVSRWNQVDGLGVGTSVGCAFLVAPDVLGECRIVDKGIVVALFLVNLGVTGRFLVRDRVLTMPFEEESEGLVGERSLAAGVVEDLVAFAALREVLVEIACDHIEIHACDVAFVLVGGFKDIVIAGRAEGAIPYLTAQTVGPNGCLGHFTIRPRAP